MTSPTGRCVVRDERVDPGGEAEIWPELEPAARCDIDPSDHHIGDDDLGDDGVRSDSDDAWSPPDVGDERDGPGVGKVDADERDVAERATGDRAGLAGSDELAPATLPTAGFDLAQQALAAARAAPRQRQRRRVGRERRMSGPGPDEHDPAPLGALVQRFVSDRGWDRTLADAGVFGRWEELVGAEIAGHCRPVRLERAELILVAESTAWATQLRLLAPTLLARLAEQVGAEVVIRIRVHGPTGPTWRHGPRRILGRGPRDTYG